MKKRVIYRDARHLKTLRTSSALDVREGALCLLAAGPCPVKLGAGDDVALVTVRAIGAEALEEALAHAGLVIHLKVVVSLGHRLF